MTKHRAKQTEQEAAREMLITCASLTIMAVVAFVVKLLAG